MMGKIFSNNLNLFIFQTKIMTNGATILGQDVLGKMGTVKCDGGSIMQEGPHTWNKIWGRLLDASKISDICGLHTPCSCLN